MTPLMTTDAPAPRPELTVAPATSFAAVPALGHKPTTTVPTGSRPVRSSKWLRFLSVAGLLTLGTVALGGMYATFGNAFRPPRADLLTHRVSLESLGLTVVERGTLESADNRDVVCRVKAKSASAPASTIKWVIDDGTHVTKGQLLVELDSSALDDQFRAQEITVSQAYAAKVQAEESLNIARSQNASDIKTAEIAAQLAALELDKYLNGEYRQQLKDVQGRLDVAKSELKQNEDRARWSERMAGRGYLSNTQAEADRARREGARIAVEKIQEELRVLEDFTYLRTAIDLQGKLDEAKRALDRVKQQARSKEVQAETEVKTKTHVYRQEVEKQQEVEEQIRLCTIRSPQDGMVVYFVSEQSRWGSGSSQSVIAQGEPVREGQRLMRIPDLRRMLVNTRVNESMVARIRGDVWRPTGFSESVQASLMTGSPHLFAQATVPLVYFDAFREKYRNHDQSLESEGLIAQVRVDAFPDRPLKAHIRTVATVASQQDWMSSDVRVYQTMVSIDEPLDGLKPGMSAEVTMMVETALDAVLTIPVQAVVGAAEMGKKRKCFVQTSTGPEEREITLGLSNEKMVEVRTGLQEGDVVVLNPKVLLGDKAKTREAGETKGNFGDKKGKGGPPKGDGAPKGKQG